MRVPWGLGGAASSQVDFLRVEWGTCVSPRWKRRWMVQELGWFPCFWGVSEVDLEAERAALGDEKVQCSECGVTSK